MFSFICLFYLFSKENSFIYRCSFYFSLFFYGGGGGCVLSFLGNFLFLEEVNIADECSWPMSKMGHSATPTVTMNNSLFGHFRGSMTFTPITERMTAGLGLPLPVLSVKHSATKHPINSTTSVSVNIWMRETIVRLTNFE